MKPAKINPQFNPVNALKLANKAVFYHRLNLSGAVVLTESSNGNYAIGPVIAALAGAKKVYALIKKSKYSSVTEAKRDLDALLKIYPGRGCIKIVYDKTKAVFGDCDIITNTGLLRPIDKKTVNWMKGTGVVPLMYEPWEFRKQDIDLSACRKRGIAVLGTNETKAGREIFGLAGELCLKQLLAAGIKIKGSRILVVQDSKFGPPICKTLKINGARVMNSSPALAKHRIRNLDVIVVAANPKSGPIIGKNGYIDPKILKVRSPKVIVAQFYGEINRDDLRKAAIKYFPVSDPGPGHMGVTFGAFDPEPLVYLFTAGLKVAQILWSARISGLTVKEAKRMAVLCAPGEDF